MDNFGSDYLSRWSKDKGVSPIGFGMLMSAWDTNAAVIPFHKYQSDDSPEGEYYLMSKYNNKLSEPFIYVSQPHRGYESLESLEEIKKRPKEIRDDLRKYLTHKYPVRKITQITYSASYENIDEGNIGILQESSAIHVERSDSTSLSLVFDHGGNKQKEFMLSDQIKLIIKY